MSLARATSVLSKATLLLSLHGCRAACAEKEWSLAATGDFLGDMVTSNDTLIASVESLVRSVDVGFFNLEGQLMDIRNFAGYPASENGGDNFYGGVGGGPTYDVAQGHIMSDWGFSLASLANNHAWDYDLLGMETTQRNLADADITFAGSGHSLSEARNASYYEKDGLRLGFVAAAGSHTPQSVAGPGNVAPRYIAPRPGVNVLRAGLVTVVDSLETILSLAAAQGQELPSNVTDVTLYTGQHQLAWSSWRLARDGEVAPSIAWDVNEEDYRGILDSIHEASQSSDATIFSLHAHESFTGTDDSVKPLRLEACVPADYTQNISRAAIDAGAAVVLVHGPHTLRGIEIYNGQPIFYGLGSWTYGLGLNFRGVSLPIEWDDGLVALLKFRGRSVNEIALHPLVHNQLVNDTTIPDAAMPRLAPGPQAERILGHLQKVSAPFGTNITVADNVGYVQL